MKIKILFSLLHTCTAVGRLFTLLIYVLQHSLGVQIQLHARLEDFILLGLVCVRGVRSCIASCSLNTYYIYAGVHSFALVCVCSLRCALWMQAPGGAAASV
jgi:hypothetical protein